MTAWPALIILIAAVAPPVEVATLNGEQHVGQLEHLVRDRYQHLLEKPTRVRSTLGERLT